MYYIVIYMVLLQACCVRGCCKFCDKNTLTATTILHNVLVDSEQVHDTATAIASTTATAAAVDTDTSALLLLLL
jgi:biotin synthase-like enzyme